MPDVTPLSWVSGPYTVGHWWIARTPIGEYHLWEQGPETEVVRPERIGQRVFSSIEAAKAYVEELHRKMVLSCLSPSEG